MKKYGLNELRKKYLEFFECKGHLVMKSFSLVPKNDKSLLLINAGMAPLKPYFTCQAIPPSSRLATCQKCIRTGDIENVGKTDRHGTFFEMLGNFSFGDYFKKEAIAWAWEFFTETLEIPKDRLYVSVYEEDDEAAKIWHEEQGVPLERIFRMGKEDNFWEHGTGPCGPCSEIYYDRGEAYGCGSPDCTVGCECDRYIEVWNLVFTQFEKNEKGEYHLLDHPNIDTGMGLERLAVIMQDVQSLFDVDTIKALRDAVCKAADIKYLEDSHKDISIRLITDHIRSVTFMTSDGILPSNEGRGYVLRRLLRRAARHGKLLGIKGQFLSKLSRVVIDTSKEAYPELSEKAEYINKIIGIEEERFSETIDQGLCILKSYIQELKENGETVLAGDKSFKLYDTYGFPLDLTIEILEEEGLTVDEQDFNTHMETQRERARSAREDMNYMGCEETVYHQLEPSLNTKFIGYEHTNYESVIKDMTDEQHLISTLQKGDKGTIFTEKTPFYATSGGQCADKGYMETETGKMTIEDVKKVMGNKIAHIGTVTEGKILKGQEVQLKVDEANRYATAKNHTATHILQKALRDIIGTHVEQAGSHLNADRLRFDFTHYAALTAEEIKAVEAEVNKRIQQDMAVNTTQMPIEEARKMGAMALFGEKYEDIVRVVNIGSYSIELCGGTHVDNTTTIGPFKIISESGIAAGVRRIEALTSHSTIAYYQEKEALMTELCHLLKCEPTQSIKRIQQILDDNKKLQQERDKYKDKLAKGAADNLCDKIINIKGMQLLAAHIPDQDMNGLRTMGDQLKQNLGADVVVLATSKGEKVNLVVMAANDAVEKGAHAGNLIRDIAKIVGGGGGGRPTIAQAGGKNPDKIDEAIQQVPKLLEAQIK